ncbi:Carboxylate/amino_acid/amine transporter family protein [Hexamita inflata]|uniref:Carboxylate/amino_acid/amine transporter family protein n=1 Tax=Hexamita inflata TaxID=28002 RepID=A0ABP1JGQ8_9EUKA
MKAKLFILSQILCIISCAVGSIQQIININFNTNLQFTMYFFFYSFQLCMFVIKQNRTDITRKLFIQTFALGLFDCCVNACCAQAYAYVNMANVSILLCLVAPFSMIFGKFILKATYNFKQLAAAFVTIIFAIAFTLLDISEGESKNKLLGDSLAIIAALGYSLDSTISEILSKNVPTQRYISLMAIGGWSLSLILMLFFNVKHFNKTPWQSFILFIPLSILQQCYQFLQIFITQKSSAVTYNLSTLCTNFYSFATALFILNSKMNFVQIIFGLGIVFGVAVFFVGGENGAEGSVGRVKDDIEVEVALTESQLGEK